MIFFQVTATGWGRLVEMNNKQPKILQEVHLRADSHEECKEFYHQYPFAITENMICAGHKQDVKDTCQVCRIKI